MRVKIFARKKRKTLNMNLRFFTSSYLVLEYLIKRWICLHISIFLSVAYIQTVQGHKIIKNVKYTIHNKFSFNNVGILYDLKKTTIRVAKKFHKREKI